MVRHAPSVCCGDVSLCNGLSGSDEKVLSALAKRLMLRGVSLPYAMYGLRRRALPQP